MLILEGLDATGKSYLAKKLSDHTGWPVHPSEGPEKYPGEAIIRMKLYLALPYKTIFDRHPIISQSIYGPLSNGNSAPPYLLQELKRIRPFIIEASPENKGKHIIKEHDTPQHLKMIKEKREVLKKAYREFLDEHFPTRTVYTFNNTEEVINKSVSYARRLRDF